MELALYDAGLALKPQIVAVNKIDIPDVRERKGKIAEDFRAVGVEPIFISAATGEGTAELMNRVSEMLKAQSATRKQAAEEPKKVFRPAPRESRVHIEKQGNTFVVVSPDIERIAAGSDVNNPEVVRQLLGLMARRQVNRLLEEAGVKPGDTIRCGNFEWKW
jgi:GTP-binding protein